MSDNIHIDGFERILLTGSKNNKNSVGQACFIKSDLIEKVKFRLIAKNTYQDTNEYLNNDIVEMSCFACCLKSEYILFFLIYKHPSMKKYEFKKQFTEFYNNTLRLPNKL